MTSPLLIGGLGTPEIVLIFAVIVLLFGASKLPELARGSGRALRIFKAETKGLIDGEDEDELKTDEQREIEARAKAKADAERIAREQGDPNA
jgi:sec-independent protein translocase protein TatA